MRTRLAPFTTLLTVAALTAPLQALDTPASTKRASESSAGVQGNGHSGTGPGYALSLSADGNTVVFLSVATNLVPGDTNGARDVFVRDCLSGTTTRVSVASDGTQANGASSQPTISGDGRYVAFSSSATNLVTNDPNAWDDVFLHDRQTGVTQRISTMSTVNTGNGTSENPRLSADGRYVSFFSAASDLVAGDTNGTGDVFVYDRVQGTLERVSVSSAGAQANDNSAFGWLSADGRYVAFASRATNLAGIDINGHWDIFVRDRQLFTTERIGPAAPAQWNADSFFPSISDTGRWVAFESAGTNIAGPDTNGILDVFVYDRQTSTAERVSEHSSGAQGDAASQDAAISGNGQYVTFESDASNLVNLDTNGWADVFRHHVPSGTTRRVSLTDAGQEADSLSLGPSVSAGGRTVAFVSFATNLVTPDTNFSPDVFVRDVGPGLIGINYCVGATNSVGLNGKISASGSPYAVDDDFTLTAHDTPPNKSGIFFYGPNQVQIPFGNGFRCVGGSTQRIQPVVQTDSAGSACQQLHLDSEPALSDITNVAPILMNFQFWHRDAMATTNLTDAVQVRFL